VEAFQQEICVARSLMNVNVNCQFRESDFEKPMVLDGASHFVLIFILGNCSALKSAFQQLYTKPGYKICWKAGIWSVLILILLRNSQESFRNVSRFENVRFSSNCIFIANVDDRGTSSYFKYWQIFHFFPLKSGSSYKKTVNFFK